MYVDTKMELIENPDTLIAPDFVTAQDTTLFTCCYAKLSKLLRFYDSNWILIEKIL